MKRSLIIKSLSGICLFLLANLMISTAFADDHNEILLAKSKTPKKPILHHVLDPDIKKAMEEDPELQKKYEAAIKARSKRRTTGSVLIGIGTTAVGIGLIAGFGSKAINKRYDNLMQQVMIYGGIGGIAVLVPGILIRTDAFPTQAEKDYMNYIRNKYHQIPILQNDPYEKDNYYAGKDTTVCLNVLSVGF